MRKPLAGVAVIFDLDGTLIDTADDLAAAMNHVLIAKGLPPTPTARVRHLVGRGARALIRQGIVEAGGEARDDLEAEVSAFLAYYLDHIADASRPFPGALAAIEALKSDGAVVAICTNKRQAWAEALIEALGLSSTFKAIVGADTVGVAKPDPRPVRHCLGLTGAESGVFIGDSDIDIEAAAAAGLPCLAALFGYGPLDRRDQAFASFSNYAEAAALVRRAATA